MARSGTPGCCTGADGGVVGEPGCVGDDDPQRVKPADQRGRAGAVAQVDAIVAIVGEAEVELVQLAAGGLVRAPRRGVFEAGFRQRGAGVDVADVLDGLLRLALVRAQVELEGGEDRRRLAVDVVLAVLDVERHRRQSVGVRLLGGTRAEAVGKLAVFVLEVGVEEVRQGQRRVAGLADLGRHAVVDKHLLAQVARLVAHRSRLDEAQRMLV